MPACEVWLDSLIAIDTDKIVGVGRAQGNFISDLWVKQGSRSVGVGAALLRRLERRILESGHSEAKLRVVSEKHQAIRFYVSNGWILFRSYPHERDGHLMTEMGKRLW
jgi:GNAT superfamily N-acetyltransferase